MSLYKQIWLTIIAVAIVIFALLALSSLDDSVNFADNELTKNSTIATNYSQQLINSYNNDPSSLVNKANQIGKLGVFEKIIITTADGKTALELDYSTSSRAPAFLSQLFKLPNEWKTIAIKNSEQVLIANMQLLVKTDDYYSYLWQSLRKLGLILLAGSLIMGICCGLAIRRLKKPLEEIIKRANAIESRQFEQIPDSSVPELQSVVHAINSLINRINVMFTDEAERVVKLRFAATIDQASGIAKREHFLDQLSNLLSNPESNGGIVMLLRLTGLGQVDQRLGRSETDLLIAQIGKILTQYAEPSHGFCGRMCSTDFVLCLRLGEMRKNDFSKNEIITPEDCALEVIEKLQNEIKVEGLIFHVGVTQFGENEPKGTILSRLDQALATAEGKNEHYWCYIPGEVNIDMPSTQKEWLTLFAQAIELAKFKLVRYPVRLNDGNILHFECALRIQLANGNWIAAQSFLGMAARLKMIAKLDAAVFTMILNFLEHSKDNIAINLSAESLKESGFLMKIEELLANHPNSAERLWIDIPESDVFANIDSIHHLISVVKPLRCKVGMEHVGHRFTELPRLQGLGLDYVKLDGSFIHNIHQNKGNQSFIYGLTAMAHNLGALVIAENVHLQDEKDFLQSIAVDAYTGPGVQAS